MSHNNTGGGFTVHNAPGGGQTFNGGYYPNTPPQNARTSTKTSKSPQEELAYEEINTKISSPKRQMSLGLTEKYVGLGSNVVQAITTFYSFIQICLGLKDTTLATYGPFKGLFIVVRDYPIYALIGLIMGIGAQLLLQAGCQRISKKWKAEHITQNQDQRVGILKVAMNDKIGFLFTVFGFIIDGVSDVSFVFAFHIPIYVCVLFGLMNNGLSTFLYYDGDERFHAAYMVWWRLEMAKRAWAQAVVEKARAMQGLSKDGKTVVQYAPQ